MNLSGNPFSRSGLANWKNDPEGIATKQKRAGRPALFKSIFLLPVGLADLMTGTLLRFPTAVNREFAGSETEKRPHR